jgi:ATPase subunit of ABC transporter with duplicated ATPase domains
MAEQVILRFDEVTFEYQDHKPLLDEADFSVRAGKKIALMGQNGAGKSTLFKLITGDLKPKDGKIFLTPKELTVGIAKQVMAPEYMELPVREYFATAFEDRPYNLDGQIRDVLEAVDLDIDYDKLVKSLSGGQQARLLLAYALIQDPDILLLDEPTNNLDPEGIGHLTGFLMMYEKTVLVISHDAEFLNAFTDGVLYLDVFTHKIEQYTGTYHDVVEEIKNRIAREQEQNARAEKEIKRLKAQAEVFAHKGGKLRFVAKKMRTAAEEAEESKVDVRKEDRPINNFIIPSQEFSRDFNGKTVQIDTLTMLRKGKEVTREVNTVIRKDMHVIIAGPNGIGKSTLLKALVNRSAPGCRIPDEVKIGYYAQDFSTLDYNQTAYESIASVMDIPSEQIIRAVGSKFLLDGKALSSEIKYLSEGQKGLLSFARLTLIKPGLLILDEPTNHINFRHLPIIAKALDEFKGAIIMVSHSPEFVEQMRIDETIDLSKL